jgi:hypothetical protein
MQILQGFIGLMEVTASKLHHQHSRIRRTINGQDLAQAILNALELLNGEENLSVSSFRPPFESVLSVG